METLESWILFHPACVSVMLKSPVQTSEEMAKNLYMGAATNEFGNSPQFKDIYLFVNAMYGHKILGVLESIYIRIQPVSMVQEALKWPSI